MIPQTSDEFNSKYQFWLENGHYGLALENKDALKYLDEEFQELTKIPGFQYSQIKSKFNFFCFYCDKVDIGKIIEIQDKLKEIYSGT